MRTRLKFIVSLCYVYGPFYWEKLDQWWKHTLKKEQTFQGLLPIQFSKLHLKKFNKKFQYQKLTDRDVQKLHEYVIRLNCLKWFKLYWNMPRLDIPASEQLLSDGII